MSQPSTDRKRFDLMYRRLPVSRVLSIYLFQCEFTCKIWPCIDIRRQMFGRGLPGTYSAIPEYFGTFQYIERKIEFNAASLMTT